MQQLQQKDWCEQQIAEKQMKKEVEKINNLAFDEQALQFHDTLKYRTPWPKLCHPKASTQAEVLFMMRMMTIG